MLALLASPWKNEPSIATTVLAKQQHEAAVYSLQACPVLFAEVGDRPITWPQVLQ
jgi:hypothetical protein